MGISERERESEFKESEFRERERERERMRILMERMTMMLYIIVGARGYGQRLFFFNNYFEIFFFEN